MGFDFSELPWENIEVEDLDWSRGRIVKWVSGDIATNEQGYDETNRIGISILPDGLEYLATHPEALLAWLNEDYLTGAKFQGPTASSSRFVQPITLNGKFFAQKCYGEGFSEFESADKQLSYYLELDNQLSDSPIRIPKLHFALEHRLLMEPLFGFPTIEDLRRKSDTNQEILDFYDKQSRITKPYVDEDGIYLLKGNPIEKSKFVLTDPRAF